MVLDAFPVFFQQEKNLKSYGSSPLISGTICTLFYWKTLWEKIPVFYYVAFS